MTDVSDVQDTAERREACAAPPHGLVVEVGDYDHRRFPRRRGAVLAKAINDAVVEELAERGYAGFTFEGVASRAGTGKSTLYRRWADKPAIVIDGLSASMPDLAEYRSSGNLRDDLIAVLSVYGNNCDGTLGVALRVVCGEAAVSADLKKLWQERAVAPRLALIRGLIQEAIDRGEARPGALAEECVTAGPALVGATYMRESAAPSRETIERIVDNVMIPMLEARKPVARRSSAG